MSTEGPGELPRVPTSTHECSFRPITPEDSEFLFRVYASTREEELAPLPWSAAEKEAFLRQQAGAQHQHYQRTMPGASYQVILRAGEPIGRLYVERSPREIHLIDIALLPAWRGRGIGGGLLRDLLAEGRRTGRKVTIYVEHYNRALHLYERLGFRHVADEGVYYLMEWTSCS